MPMTKQEEREHYDAIAKISDEDRERSRREYDDRFKAFLASGGDGGAPFNARRQVESAPVPLSALLGRVAARINDDTADRLSLPCYQAMYPDGVEPDDLAARVSDAVGAKACDDVQAWRDCTRGQTGFGCPRVRVGELRERVRENLVRARVPKLDYELVLKHASGRAALFPYDSMMLVQAVRRAKGGTVNFKEANEQLVGDRERVNAAFLTGDETVVLMGGCKGRGKTTAAVYALGHDGGLYTTEYAFTRPRNAGGQDITEAKRAKTLVIDQFGRGHLGDSKYALASIEEVIDARKAEKLTTYLVGNFDWDDAFKRRYDELVVSRIMGHGVVVVFRGEDLREKLRNGRAA